MKMDKGKLVSGLMYSEAPIHSLAPEINAKEYIGLARWTGEWLRTVLAHTVAEPKMAGRHAGRLIRATRASSSKRAGPM